jgi:hypothetical protein
LGERHSPAKMYGGIRSPFLGEGDEIRSATGDSEDENDEHDRSNAVENVPVQGHGLRLDSTIQGKRWEVFND